jgi:hypothetical protein
MVVRKRPLVSIALLCGLAALVLVTPAPVQAQKFYPDDPLQEEPAPIPAVHPQARALSEILEAFSNTLGSPGERNPEIGVIPAGGVNTLGEVLDGPWYVNRHASRRMSQEELLRGPGEDHPPFLDAPWEVLVVKPYGLRPGILIADSTKDLYLLRFDPPGHLEAATGAEMVASRFFHALGYYVPEHYILYFKREQLIASEAGEEITSLGESRDLLEVDIDAFLGRVAVDADRGYRTVATRIGRWTGLLGPYQVYGLRSDDPNDIVPHEHRRDLRGLFVFCAWLNHNLMRAMNTMDVLAEEDGIPRILHYLVDFSHALGSGGVGGPKRPFEGNETFLDGGRALKNIVSFGIVTPRWMRASYPDYPAVGKLESETFEPERWTTNHVIAPFANRLPDDEFWAAKKVMAFTDEDVETLVRTGRYSDSRAEEWIARTLRERRDRIGRTYFQKVLPLDNFRIEDDELRFDDLEMLNNFVSDRNYSVQWLEVENQAERVSSLTGAISFAVPSRIRDAVTGSYFGARIGSDDREHTVVVYFRKEPDQLRVVGIEHDWQGKMIADPARDVDTGISRFVDLSQPQKGLFGPYTDQYNETTGVNLTPEQYFDSLTISERTTYDAVTHALINSRLTDESGAPLGTAFDLISGVERIAGQYYGRGGDEQFRLYVHLKPGARETLERAQEFRLGQVNTVYHVGYPISFRQTGREPTIQFSVSEDGTQADIDVDYRSSKAPQSLFNGHLTSANSDVRQGDNYERHNGRWAGLIAWWQGIFGNVDEEREVPGRDILASTPEPPTPLPPDRPRGARIDGILDAVQEFLTDWLVRREYDEGIDFLSARAFACLNVDDFVGEEALDADRARRELAEIMRYSTKEMGALHNLTEAIDPAQPLDPSRIIVSHPFQGEFTLFEMPAEAAESYLCGQGQPEGLSDYHAVLLRFKKPGAAILGLLWAQENGQWRIVSYRVFEQ